MMALFNIKSLALLAWMFVNVVLALAIGRELGWGESLRQPVPKPVAHPSAPVEIVLHPDFRLPAQQDAYDQTLERPLFVPNRRPAPPAPPAPPPPPPVMQKGQFQLLGTVITDEMKSAVVKEVSSGKERQVVQGFTINGLQLEAVEADRIVFTQYDDREEIRLKIQASPKPVAPPPGAQPAKPQAGSDASRQADRPARRAAAQSGFGGAAEKPVVPRAAAPSSASRTGGRQAERPAAPPAAPKTIEDRKSDPLLKDFYK
ncbi:MAG: hypothetical protein QG662_1516 [Pseudomonadota bacterium]|nr:hypothetical protein [Pseudomonadota bacterium]